MNSLEMEMIENYRQLLTTANRKAGHLTSLIGRERLMCKNEKPHVQSVHD